MSLTTEAAVEEIKKLLAPMPDGFVVERNEETDGVLVHGSLGFAITRQSIEDGRAVTTVRAVWPDLLLKFAERCTVEAERFKTRQQQDMTVDVDVD